MTEHLNLPARAELLMEQRYGKHPGELDSARVPAVPVEDKGQALGDWKKKKTHNKNLPSQKCKNKNTVAMGR